MQGWKTADKPPELLLDFIPRVTPTYTSPTHLQELCSLLDATYTQPVKAVISVPPQHAKSQTILHHLVQRTLLRPQARNAYISYGADFSGTQAQLAMITAKNQGMLLPVMNQHRWMTRTGGGVIWGGVMGPLTGRPIDGILVVDDPYKNRTDAESPAYHRRLMDWWTGVALPRAHPGSSIIVVQARWTETDLAGTLIEQGWHHVSLPAIREDGTPLWPEERPLDWLHQQQQDVGEMDWWSQYMCSPRPRGTRLMRGVHHYDAAALPTSAYELIAGADWAYTSSSRADESVAIEARLHNGHVYLTNAVIMQTDAPTFGQALHATLEASIILTLYGGTEKGTLQFLNQYLIQQGSPKRVVGTPRTAGMDKYRGSLPLVQAWNDGKILLPAHMPAWAVRVRDQCLGFTGTDSGKDDIVDALVPLAMRLGGASYDDLRRAAGRARTHRGRGRRR